MTVTLTKASDYAAKYELTLEQDHGIGYYKATAPDGTIVVELWAAEPADFREALRKATRTVREVMDEEFGEGWERGESHLVTVVNNYSTGYEDVMTVNHAVTKEQFGYDDAVSVSNYEELEEMWGELDCFTYSPWSNNDTIALKLDEGIAPDDLEDVIRGLSDYPVLNESRWSEVEQRMIDEDWESYGRRDTFEHVAQALEIEELSDAAEEIITILVWEGITGEYPERIDASAVEFHAEDVAEWIKARLGTVVTHNNYGRVNVFDLTRRNLTWH
ncbi:hypothetical protein [Rhodococcus phage RGL3]|uniref:Uncharacterized protein n=1 Tax=Rhodococcus phage RGL3 TaxID=2922221 RepID=G9FHQ3_9CAUD|nr:hypothetical protein RoPhRGL3_gp61 [Rhodococcus phage RGL3]AEV52141.1 hypothetical protein [Rhodococcus phage RGL3]